jgi:hypothetical protein
MTLQLWVNILTFSLQNSGKHERAWNRQRVHIFQVLLCTVSNSSYKRIEGRNDERLMKELKKEEKMQK